MTLFEKAQYYMLMIDTIEKDILLEDKSLFLIEQGDETISLESAE